MWRRLSQALAQAALVLPVACSLGNLDELKSNPAADGGGDGQLDTALGGELERI